MKPEFQGGDAKISIWEWYYNYNKESQKIGDTKREYKYACIGTFKIGFMFGIFGDIVTSISILLGNIWLVLSNQELISSYEFLSIVFMLPIISTCLMTLVTIISLFIHPFIENIFNKIAGKEFCEIIVIGFDGWFQLCVFIGNNKLERNKFSK